MERRLLGLGLGAVAVVLWRLLALRFPHDAATDPQVVRLAMAPLGIWFLLCGAWVWRRVETPATLLFALYCVTAGLHWGGPLGVGPQGSQNLLLAFYVVIATLANQALFLHLAVAFPPAVPWAFRRWTLAAVYLPVLAGGLLWLVLLVQPTSEGLLRVFLPLLPVGMLYGLIGGVVFLYRFVRSSPAARRQHRLDLVVVALLVGAVPQALAAAGITLVPGYDGLFNLTIAFEPVAFAFALGKRKAGSLP